MPGPMELIIILVIVILVFGGKRIKNLGSDLGGAIKGFKKSVKDTDEDIKKISKNDEVIVKKEKVDVSSEDK
jgi:sec-independent protein translocase protein TatA